MMDITKIIKTGVEQNKIILGYRTVMKSMKTSRPEMIVFANNFPEDKRRMIKHNANIIKIEVKEYPNDSVNLGLVCGKPFPVGVLAIKRSKK